MGGLNWFVALSITITPFKSTKILIYVSSRNLFQISTSTASLNKNGSPNTSKAVPQHRLPAMPSVQPSTQHLTVPAIKSTYSVVLKPANRVVSWPASRLNPFGS
jgi:hypothetical protein